jgi:hypothetical protein
VSNIAKAAFLVLNSLFKKKNKALLQLQIIITTYFQTSKQGRYVSSIFDLEEL